MRQGLQRKVKGKQMKRLDDSTDPVWVKACLYGKPGTGKTSFGVSAPKPLILLSEAQGLVHVKQAARRLGVPVPPTFLVESVEDYRSWLRALQGSKDKPLQVFERHRTLDGKVSDVQVVELEEWPETVVLDSITDAGRLIVEEIRRMSPPKKGQDGLPVDSQRFWSVLSDKFKALVLEFRNLPLHVVFLGLVDDREDGDEGNRVRNVTIDLPMRKMPAILAAAVNVIGYTFRRETRDADKPTRLEYGVMTTGPEYMTLKPYRPLRDTEVPDFSKWVAMIRGQLVKLPSAPTPSSESLMSADDGAKAAVAAQATDEAPTETATEAAPAAEPKPATEKKKRTKKGEQKDADA